MSQFDFGVIDPNVKTGTQLAADLNAWRTALHTTHSGIARPAYVQPGMLWTDTSAAPTLVLYVFDGTNDVEIMRYNTATHAGTLTNAVPRTAATGAAVMPAGTAAQRPGAPVAGYTRWNSDLGALESYNGAAWVQGAGSEFGQCYLSNQGANLTLNPQNGNKLFINGAFYTIPVAGVVLAPTALVGGNLYFIYASQAAGVISLAASLTAPAKDATYGNQIKTGDPFSVLVGAWISAGGGGAWSTNDACGISFYNRKLKSVVVEAPANSIALSSSPGYGAVPTLLTGFVTWADEAVAVDASLLWFLSSPPPGNIYSGIGIDSTVAPQPGTSCVNHAFDGNFRQNDSHTRVSGLALAQHTAYALFKTDTATVIFKGSGATPETSSMTVSVRG